VSILSPFYKQLFQSKAFGKAFMCLKFEFVIFWQKKLVSKPVHEADGEID